MDFGEFEIIDREECVPSGSSDAQNALSDDAAWEADVTVTLIKKGSAGDFVTVGDEDSSSVDVYLLEGTADERDEDGDCTSDERDDAGEGTSAESDGDEDGTSDDSDEYGVGDGTSDESDEDMEYVQHPESDGAEGLSAQVGAATPTGHQFESALQQAQEQAGEGGSWSAAVARAGILTPGRESERNPLYEEDSAGELVRSIPLAQVMAELAAFFAQNKGRVAALLVLLFAVNLIPIIHYVTWGAPTYDADVMPGGPGHQAHLIQSRPAQDGGTHVGTHVVTYVKSHVAVLDGARDSGAPLSEPSRGGSAFVIKYARAVLPHVTATPPVTVTPPATAAPPVIATQPVSVTSPVPAAALTVEGVADQLAVEQERRARQREHVAADEATLKLQEQMAEESQREHMAAYDTTLKLHKQMAEAGQREHMAAYDDTLKLHKQMAEAKGARLAWIAQEALILQKEHQKARAQAEHARVAADRREALLEATVRKQKARAWQERDAREWQERRAKAEAEHRMAAENRAVVLEMRPETNAAALPLRPQESLETNTAKAKDMPARTERAGPQKLRQQLSEALVSIARNIDIVPVCRKSLGWDVQAALMVDWNTMDTVLQYSEGVREGHEGLAGGNAVGNGMQARLPPRKVDRIESLLGHVVSTYSATVSELAANCSLLSLHGGKISLTPTDLQNLEAAAAVQAALCVDGFESKSAILRSDGDFSSRTCQSAALHRVVKRLLSSRLLYRAVLSALRVDEMRIADSRPPAIPLPPVPAPALGFEERRAKPVFSFPVGVSSCITPLQLKGSMD